MSKGLAFGSLRQFPSGLLLVYLLVGLLAGYSITSNRKHHLAAAQTAVSNLSHSLAEGISADLQDVDMLLQTAADQMEYLMTRGGANPQMDGNVRRLLEILASRLPLSTFIFAVTDAQGTILHSTASSPPGDIASLADRPYFMMHRERPGSGLLLSPRLIGKLTGKVVFTLSRRYNGPDGQFAGVVATAVSLDNFAQRFADMEIGRHGTITLRGDASRQFDLLVHHPRTDRLGTMNYSDPLFAVSEQLRASYAANPDQGQYQTTIKLDNVARILAYSRVGTFPLLVIAGLGLDDIEADLLPQTLLILTLSLLLAFFATLGGWLLLTAQRHKRAAETANHAKSEFLARMSHEIRTPMNSVSGFAHLLARTRLDHQQQEYVRKILASTEHLLTIVNDLLDFSKLEAGPPELAITDVSLHHLLATVAGLLVPQCDEKGLELILDIANEVPDAIRTDPARLRQILGHLTNNALKFTDRGTIILRVRVEESEQRLRFSIIDSGCGMAHEQTGQLFAAFVRGDNGVTRQYGGTGLGLSISRSLVESMGGTIGVESREGQGSTFWFTLPLHPVTGPQIVRRHLDANCRVLVADDHPLVRELLGYMLLTLGLAADTCASGEETLGRLRVAEQSGRPYDLLLADWQMPGMDGFELARRLRAAPDILRKPSMVLLSSRDNEAIRNQGTALGFQRFLTKPITQAQLFITLASLLAPEIPAADGLPQEAPLDDEQSELSGRRILLVEDNLVNQQVSLELLAAAGIVADVADDGQLALVMVAVQSYDLILMDMHMPVMDGIAATRHIRATHDQTALPILALTANAIPSELQRCLEAGMNDTITKPIDPADLYSKLRRWLPRKTMAAQDQSNPGTGQEEIRAAATPLPDIQGLDARAGVRRLLGNAGVYRSILQRFVADEADAMVRLRTHLASGNLASAQHEVHSLKGVAGTIGALQVQKLARGVEATLRSGAIPEAAALDELETVLSVLLLALRQWFASTTT